MTQPNLIGLVAAAMVAFAANSVLCRMAIGSGYIDAYSFTSIRVVSGAFTLWIIYCISQKRITSPVRNWQTGLSLTTYMVFFSLAYQFLDTGVGALLLFGSVQFTMLLVGFWQGERLSRMAWAGLLAAVVGLGLLLLPNENATATQPLYAVLMMIAGIGWGIYSLLGRGMIDPIESTCGSFIFCAPIVVALSFLNTEAQHLELNGLILAGVSGVMASALGYAVWYAALPHLRAISASTVQLSVPVIAALAGIILLGESLSGQLILACLLTVGGLAVVLVKR
ncbi:MAG: DMT family transporter [Pseudomonadota bacterium]